MRLLLLLASSALLVACDSVTAPEDLAPGTASLSGTAFSGSDDVRADLFVNDGAEQIGINLNADNPDSTSAASVNIVLYGRDSGTYAVASGGADGTARIRFFGDEISCTATDGEVRLTEVTATRAVGTFTASNGDCNGGDGPDESFRVEGSFHAQ